MFNESQQRAISHYLGPAIILAGPGSGKTTVITHRIKKLIMEYNVPPEKIMVATFTKAAAVNMRQRFNFIVNEDKKKSFNGEKIYPITFGTFHSIFYKILRVINNYKEDNILSESQKLNIIKEISIRFNIQVPSLNDFAQNVVAEISKIKGNMLDIREYISTQCSLEDFRRLYDAYNQELEALGKMDFDDILIKSYEILRDNMMLRKQWQETFSHILVDEFQDINKVQYEIVKLLAYPENNLFIVGDDDQSIYGFRGASPSIMKEFKQDYPKATEILLNVNYRCAKNISDSACKLIEHNKDRFEKEILAVRREKEPLEIKQFKNHQQELSYVAHKIQEYMKKGVKQQEIVILVRNNSSIKTVKEVLENRGIISDVHQRKSNIFDCEVGKDILAYLKATENYDKCNIGENDDLLRIINKPPRLISRKVMAIKDMNIDRLRDEYKNQLIQQNIDKLLFDFKILKNTSPYGMVMYIRNGMGYENYLKDYAKEKGFNLKMLLTQLDDIQREAEKYKSISDWMNNIEEMTLSNDKDKKHKGINIMTMHGAKGLEFKVVFIIDANQGIVPSSKTIRENEYEEERRVFYVAMTRAVESLNIYGIREYAGAEMQMSMFVNEILNTDEK